MTQPAPASDHPFADPPLAAAWQLVLSTQSAITAAQSALPVAELERLDLAVALLAKHAATNSARGTTPQLEQARQTMRVVCELSQLPPVSWDLLQLARESREKGDHTQAINILKKIMELTGQETPSFVKKMLSQIHLARVQQLFDGFKIEEKNLARIKPKDALANYSQLHWAYEDLLAGKRLDPHNPGLEGRLSTLKSVLTKLEPLARENFIRVKPRPGTPEKILPVLEKVAIPLQRNNTSLFFSLALLLGGGGFWGYVSHFGMPEIILAVQQDLFGPATLEHPPATGMEKSGSTAPPAKPGQASPKEDNEIGIVVPEAREGIAVQEALKKIEKMGIKVPTGEGQGTEKPAATAPAADQEAGMVVPPPKEGITVQQALKKIEQVGVKVPVVQGAVPVAAPALPPPASPLPATAIPEQAAQGVAVEPSAPREEPAPPARQEPVQNSSTPTREVSPQGDDSSRDTATPAGEDTAKPQENTPTATGEKPPLASFKPNDPVQVVLANGNKIIGRWEKSENEDSLAIRPVGRTDAPLQRLPQKEVKSVASIPEIELFLKQKVVVRRKDGTSQTGVVTAYTQEALFMEQRTKFGAMKLTIPRASVEAIKISP